MYILEKLSIILISVIFTMPIVCVVMENEIHRRKMDNSEIEDRFYKLDPEYLKEIEWYYYIF